MTPCSSSRDSCSNAPRVTMITAWWGVCPATRALIAVSRSRRYTGGTLMAGAGGNAAADECRSGDVDLHRWREQRGDSAEARHHRQHGQRIPEHEPARSAARLLLPLEEIQAS